MPYTDKEKHKAYRVERAKKMQEFLNDYKVKSGCADCGYNENPYGMEFDHLNDKTYNIGNMARYSLQKVLAEIEKCEVVCGTCHNIRTANRRQTTHGV